MKNINWWGVLTLTLRAISAGIAGGGLFWLIGSLIGSRTGVGVTETGSTSITAVTVTGGIITSCAK